MPEKNQGRVQRPRSSKNYVLNSGKNRSCIASRRHFRLASGFQCSLPVQHDFTILAELDHN